MWNLINSYQIVKYLFGRYIMGDRWFWMTGNSMAFTKWPQDLAPDRFSSPCGGLARGELVLWKDHRCEELLNFICQSGRRLNLTSSVHCTSLRCLHQLFLSLRCWAGSTESVLQQHQQRQKSLVRDSNTGTFILKLIDTLVHDHGYFGQYGNHNYLIRLAIDFGKTIAWPCSTSTTF